MDDLFLKIISREIPSEIIYEDDKTFAFLDINPHNQGHTLVIPKTKYENLFDMPEETACAIMKTAHKLAPAIKEATGADGINIGMNNGTEAGQEVMHAHIHIVPRFKDDGIYKPAKHTSYNKGEEKDIGEKIRKKIEGKI